MTDVGKSEYALLRVIDAQEIWLEDQHPLRGRSFGESRICCVLQQSVSLTLCLDGKQWTAPLQAGQLIYIPIHAEIELENQGERPSRVILIRFDGASQELWDSALGQPLTSYMPEAIDWAEQFLLAGRHNLTLLIHLQLQSYLYAMCASLLHNGLADEVALPTVWQAPLNQRAHVSEPTVPSVDGRWRGPLTSTQQAVPDMRDPDHAQALEDYVEQTLAYMQRNYKEQIDIEQLARHSGYGANRFYQCFKARTGLSPLKHMTQIRLDAALELLGPDQATVLEAAHAVGYSDEFYFSRLFKKQMGLSPTDYAQRARLRVASLSPIFEGDLQVLGIRPVVSLGRGWSRQPEQALAEIRDSRPQLILTTPVAPDIADALYRQLNAIAPTIVMHWKQCTWRERFMQTAEYLQMQTVGRRWLTNYDSRVASARAHIRDKLGDTPYLVVRAAESQFRVFDIQPNLNQLFYEELQLCPPLSVREGLNGLTVSSLEELAELGCDSVVILVDENSSDSWCRTLPQVWRKLSAKHHVGHCLVIRMARPQAFHARGRDQLIEHTVQQLLQERRYA